jgi:ATPase family associated with various cellular activities (AAA)
MNALTPDWTEANQAYIAAELAGLRRRLEGRDADPARAQTSGLHPPAAIDVLCERFGLSAFERALLLLCAGVEMDDQLASACAAAQGHENRRYASFGLALAALPEPHWSALTPDRPLRRRRLIEVESGPTLVTAPLRIDERILHFLAGINALDVRLQPLLREHVVPALMAPSQKALAKTLARGWRHHAGPLPLWHLGGDDPAGQEDVAAAVAAARGLRLFELCSEQLPSGAAELETLARLLEREAVLAPAALLLRCTEGSTGPAALLAERIHAPLFVAAREAPSIRRAVVSHEVRKPEAIEQRELWLRSLGKHGARLNGELDAVAGQFRLSARAIADAAPAVISGLRAGEPAESALWQACRVSGRRALDELAQRIAPAAGWDDLVLPPSQLASLRQIAAHVRRRVRVYDDWGFARLSSRGLGISVLFSGESGTGKTLAAEVLANELKLDLYRIDLSSVVSKYIGETEKNLARVFDGAEDSGAILLFDEADALFGKRSEVKDSHDRYANIETSYLLQRMEAYRGLAILTTNMKTALDRAFQRRLRFVVQFPFPDAALREAIWCRVFPSPAPLAEIDYAKLARLNLPGGNIRNIALNAAFLAAEAGERLTMEHLRAAAQAESAKTERPLSEAEMRGWQ